MRFRGVVCTNETCLILFSWIFCLRERKASTPTHALHRTDFLDGLLESGSKSVSEGRVLGKRKKLTVPVVVDNPEYCTFAAPVRYDRTAAYTSDDNFME